MIGMSDNEISKKYMDITIPEIIRIFGKPPIIWEATTPKTLPQNILNFGTKKPTFGTPFRTNFSETEKSVWYSHFNIWTYLKNENKNAYIFEHDVDLTKVIDLPIVENKHIICYRGIGHLECYYLTAKGATILCDLVSSYKTIEFQVDSFVDYHILCKESIQKIFFTPKFDIDQLNIYGNTIDHQPSFAT
jgi:hypothetical protein